MSVELQGVNFSYPTAPEKPVIKIEHWSINRGEQVFVHGPSGGGKSTLLSLLSGMLTPLDGQVRILGKRLDQMSMRKRDRFRTDHIGYVFQNFNLIPYLSAVDNIRLARHFSKQKDKKYFQNEIEDLLINLNIESGEWSKPTAELSNGQQQRVAIARAMINKPELVIADEPTSSLDQGNRDKFIAQLMSLVKHHNITLLFVSHDMSLSSHFNRSEALGDINQIGH